MFSGHGENGLNLAVKWANDIYLLLSVHLAVYLRCSTCFSSFHVFMFGAYFSLNRLKIVTEEIETVVMTVMVNLSKYIANIPALIVAST